MSLSEKNRYNVKNSLNLTITFNRSKFRVEHSWHPEAIVKCINTVFNKKKFSNTFYHMYLVPERFTKGDTRWYHYHGQMLIYDCPSDLEPELAGAIHGILRSKIGNTVQKWNDPEVKELSEDKEFPTYFDYCFKLNEFKGYWLWDGFTTRWINHL